MKFQKPDEVSSTSLGRDRLIIELKDVRVFKSQITGEPMDHSSFEGLPQVEVVLSPLLLDEELAENLQDTTDMISVITNFLSSANFGVGIILGGSLQSLYGMIRSMQMILLSALCDVAYPAPTLIYFQGAILFAGMDVFSGEDFYEKHFQFQHTEPVNKRFDEFGIGDKIYTSNSGSFLIMQLVIILWFFGKKLLLWVCIKYSHYKVFRTIGMYFGDVDPKSLRKGTLRLWLESYFDISIITFINVMAWIETDNIGKFFSTVTDFVNSLIVIVSFVAVFAFPVWMFMNITKYREDLMHPEFMDSFDWLFEDLRATTYDVALY